MQILLLADDAQQQALTNGQLLPGVVFTTDAADLRPDAADAFVDLLYNSTPERTALLATLLPKPVVIDAVAETLTDTHPAFVRINGWPTALAGRVVEAAAANDRRADAEALFAVSGKIVEWLPDEPGFVTPRVIAGIVNEAYLALAEGVSTKEEINLAMKLGTAYPFGPFEWAEKIGKGNIIALLRKLSETQPRYQPAPLLMQEAERS